MTVRPTVTGMNRHALRPDQFDGLAAGGGDAGTVATLLAVERSWRQLQLRAVLEAARDHPESPGPLPPLKDAWSLLTRVEQKAPDEVESLLLRPQVGTWAGYALRRLRGSTVADTPLWMETGYLHAVAAAAAIRAGIGQFSIRVPMREGFVLLPTLGGVAMPHLKSWESAEVARSGGAVTVAANGAVVEVPTDGTDANGWITPPIITTNSGGQTLSVTLDYLDPYRNLRKPIPPDALSPEQVERWQTLVKQAWDLIVKACPELAGPIGRGLFSIVPQQAAERFRTMSASAGDAFGSMIVSEPEDAPELAVTIVHEFQHIKLGGLLHLTPLHHAEPAQRLYAPWRDDPRPLGGLLQGVYAFVGIVQFWSRFRHIASGATANLAHFEFARWRGPVSSTLHMLQTLPELTMVGRHLVSRLAQTAAMWQRESVPAEILGAAEAAATDHRMRWRLHHLHPDPAAVASLVAAWQHRADRPDLERREPMVSADGAARRLDVRAVLALWRLTDPDGFAQLLDDPSTIRARVSGATPADLAYAVGNIDQARQLFLSELTADPDSPGAWAGLGLVSDGPTGDALRTHPELARAVYHGAERAGDPTVLAGWLA